MQNAQAILEKLRAVEARAIRLELTAYADPSHYRRANKLRKMRALEAKAERLRKLLRQMGVDPNSAQ